MSEKEIQDKVFNVLYRHTRVMPDSIKTTDGLWKIMDSVDTMEFARDICAECKLSNIYFFYCMAFENIKPLTIDTIVKAVIETEKHSIKYKKEFKVSDFTDIKPGPNSHVAIMKMVNEPRPWCPNDFVPQGFFPDFNKKSR